MAVTIFRATAFYRRYRETPTDRLGYGIDRLQAVQKHKWFDGFNWEGLHHRSLTPPIIPKVCIPASYNKKGQLSLTNRRDACKTFARFM